MKFCQKCGTQNQDAAGFCSKCGEPFQSPSNNQQAQTPIQAIPEKPKKKKKGCLITAIVLLVVVVFFISLGSGDDTSATLTTDTNGDVILNEEVIAQDDFKASCIEISYEELARNPENYKDQRMVFTGEVIQCEEIYNTEYYARVNVTADEYGFYSDTIYVTFNIPEGADKILEEDIVKLYGICQGFVTYTTIFGEQITIPSLDAVYVELVKK